MTTPLDRLVTGDLTALDALVAELPGTSVRDALHARDAAAALIAPVGPAASSAERDEAIARVDAELAVLFVEVQRFDAVEPRVLAALRRVPSGLASVARGRARHALGMLARRSRDLVGAQRELEHACAELAAAGDELLRAAALDSLGGVYFERLELPLAESVVRESLEIKQGRGDARGEAIAFGSLGRIAFARGDYHEALALFAQNAQRSELLGDVHGQVTMANHRAMALAALRDFDRAREVIRQGVVLASSSPRPADVPHAWLSAAHLLRLGGGTFKGEVIGAADEFVDAWRLADEAMARFSDLSQREPAAYARMERALCLMQHALARQDPVELQRAAADLDAARRVFREAQAFEGYAEASLHAAFIARCLGSAQSARGILDEGRQAVDHVESLAVAQRLRAHAAVLEIVEQLEAVGVPEADVLEAAERAVRTGEGIGAILRAKGALDRGALDQVLAAMGVAVVSASVVLDWIRARKAVTSLDPAYLRRKRVIPARRHDGAIEVVMEDPLDVMTRDEIARRLGESVRVTAVAPGDFENLLRQATETDGTHFMGCDTASKVSDRLFELAQSRRASDIHLESERNGVLIRMRIDGAVSAVARLTLEEGRQLIRRIKVMSGMDITESRRPQDGRMRHGDGSSSIDLRTSAAPTLHGEKVVVRILGGGRRRSLEELGIEVSLASRLRSIVSRREGMVVAAGPTGSGKTSLLHAVLEGVDAVGRVVATIEEPIEYEVPEFAQTQVHAEIGVGFAASMRALLRQDADVVLLGEMRDEESASIAARLALSGALVASTLHAYDAAVAVARLEHFGLSPFLVSTVLRGVVALRLVRRLCVACRRRCAPDRAALRELAGREGSIDAFEHAACFEPVGCATCGGTGFLGRVPIAEWLEVGDDIRTLIAGGATAAAIREAAIAQGMRPLTAVAVARVLAGETTAAECLRVM